MDFFDEYLDLISISIKNVDSDMLGQAARLITSTNERGGKIILAGNGGSAAIASHISVDLTNSAGIRAINFNEPDLITCFANDYGYERWLEKAVESYANKGDTVILISSSGRSRNIINAALKAKELGLDVITLSGFDADNPLRQTGETNFWVDSHVYNVVETVHNVWLSSIVDKIVDDAIRVFRGEETTMPMVALSAHANKVDDEKPILEE
jgi:D-sedoheptulose 7-phosphate isomerase